MYVYSHLFENVHLKDVVKVYTIGENPSTWFLPSEIPKEMKKDGKMRMFFHRLLA